MKKSTTFAGGLLLGVALGMLYSPRRGDDLRYEVKAFLRRRGLLRGDNVDNFVEILAAQIKDR